MPAASWFLLSVLAAEPTCPAELFRVERNKNANVVLYEANTREGRLDPREPLTATWLLLARGGGREGLSFFERFAYGFDVRAASPLPGFAVRLKALKDRTVRVHEGGPCPVALATIGGREGVLRRVYVRADERGAVPTVQSIELFGVDPESGEALFEKIDAK